MAAYASSFQGSFLFDDKQCILNCESIRSISNATNFENVPPPIGLYRRDLVRWSLVLNYAISEYETWSYHVINLLIHLTAGSILYLLIRDTLRWHVPRLKGQCIAIAFGSAILWLLHPLQTESVTYIIQRLESLASLWYLAILYCTLRAHQSAMPLRWQTLAVLAMILGVFSKEIILTAPFVVLIYDRTYLSRSYQAAVKSRPWLYGGLTFGLLIFAGNYWYYRTAFAPIPSASLRPDKIATPVEYLCSQPGVLLHYIKLSFAPLELCLDYLWPIATDPIEIYGKGAIIIALLVLGFVLLHKRPAIGFLIVSFFLILAPSSTIQPLLLAFEHRMYLPLACITTGISCLTWMLVYRVVCGEAKLPNHEVGRREPQMVKLIPMMLISSYAAFLGFQTFQRNKVYESPLVMWEDVLQKRPQNPRAWMNYGVCLDKERGETEAARAAIAQSIVLNPKFGLAWSQLGLMCFKLGRHDAASKQYEIYKELVELEDEILIPEYAESLLYAGRFSDAIAEFERIQQIPDLGIEASINCRTKKGIAYDKLDDFENAQRSFEEALALDPTSVPTLMPYAQACLNSNEHEKGLSLLLKAMRIAANNPSIPFLAAELELSRGQPGAAVPFLQESLRRDPSFVPAASTLATMMAANGHPMDAIDLLRTAANSHEDINTRRQLLSMIIGYCREAQNPELEQYFQMQLTRLPQ